MAHGEGKGWAKGKSAATDARVAKAAAAHRGMTYQRRTPPELCRWSKGGGVGGTPVGWSSEMAYALGLIATDGCLVERGRKIAFVSRDLQLMETFLACVDRPGRYLRDKTRLGKPLYRTQFHDENFYRWLLDIGLTPRKSLTLGPLDVPDEFFAPFVRGLLDGDGNVQNAVWRADTSRRSDYYWEWLRTRFCSASLSHLEWLHGRLRAALRVRGWITCSAGRLGPHPSYVLGFGKHDSIRLLSWLYANEAAPCLLRKRAIWDDYRRRHQL